ncbi:1-acyl-sn-glycerol-3-phosphate acyltransferase [Ichthyobacterium seriolicida]|uniref:1-acyl-sn-glycerol-3-phosphate acyltransferase n=2 Tax=Ichthyobacterium seriolicida TaxID=242600 RepID=A0A1J1E4K1_9FLAO|nr:1-acyl-sn-glycerol-3-phosphate acyltransferase [Ichthyobacterium seriolicida]
MRKHGAFPKDDQPYIIVSNHSSELDIYMILLLNPKQTLFIAKAELGKLPIFGILAKRTMILVDRKKLHSRKKSYMKSMETIKNGKSICIFPEGHIPDDYDLLLDRFKDGAFSLSVETNSMIVPVVFPDNKKKFPFIWSKGSPGILNAHIYEPRTGSDRTELKNDIFCLIKGELERLQPK